MRHTAGAVAVAVLALTGCGSSTTTSTPSSPDTSQASLACNHFRNIAADITKGILTPAEIRDKMKEVNSDASIGPPDVQSAATDMLAASTQDNGDAFMTAVTAMSKACKAAGS